MTPSRELLDIEEIGNLASFTPAEGLARIKSPAAVEKRRWSMLRRLAPVTALSTMAWGAAATAVLVGALVFHAAPGKTSRPTPPAAAVVAPSTAPTLAPTTVNPPTASAAATPGPTPSPRAGNVTAPSPSAAPATPTAVPPPVDLLSNSSFESSDLSGYGSWQSTATRVTSPVESGSYALKIAQLSPSDTWFTIDSWPQVVNATAGTTYTASVYVAAPPAWVGRTVELVLRESVHDVNHTNQRLWAKDVTLTSAYQLVQVSGQADANDTVSVYLGPPSSQHAGSGEYFYADVLTLTAG